MKSGFLQGLHLALLGPFAYDFCRQLRLVAVTSQVSELQFLSLDRGLIHFNLDADRAFAKSLVEIALC